MVREIIFDVETKKLFSDISSEDPAELGVSVVSVYRRIMNDRMEEIEGQMESFWDSDSLDGPYIADMWHWFEEADRIIGFNSRHFDVHALRPYYEHDFSKLKHFDIMDIVREKTGRRISLNALASDTLAVSKNDIGTNAVYYWAMHDTENLHKLKIYCEHDVAITKDLYDFGWKNKYLKYRDKWNNEAKIDVDFSYPVVKIDPQIGLF